MQLLRNKDGKESQAHKGPEAGGTKATQSVLLGLETIHPRDGMGMKAEADEGHTLQGLGNQEMVLSFLPSMASLHRTF